MIDVHIQDWVHHDYIRLKCPETVRYAIGGEPVRCKLIASSISIEVEQGFLARLFGLKPWVWFIRQPGIYDYFIGPNELVLRGIVMVDGGKLILSPDIVFSDMREFKDYREFVRYVSDEVSDVLNGVLMQTQEKVRAVIDVLRKNVDAINTLADTIGEIGNYNVRVANLVVSTLRGVNVTIDSIRQFNEDIYGRFKNLLYPPPPPPPPTQIPSIIVQSPTTQQQPQPQQPGQMHVVTQRRRSRVGGT